ncbi:MAG: class I SAM-dependent methyltransferase, partial [Thermoanaerobaculia bacterium]|nr:class I SAM-dependent methyltransferase [Thermoanaerobaculia bacterium]
DSGAPRRELARARAEQAYVDLEERHRGTEEEIRQRFRPYLERLPRDGRALDLGCGRGEALALLGEHGLEACGVDASAAMVALCRERGLEAVEGDLFEVLAGEVPGSLALVTCLHVIEHLPPEAVDRLARLAWRALEPGGTLLIETPNPLSLAVSARSFWIDPTHRRPVHPEGLAALVESAGFASIERLDLRPFDDEERLPEIALDGLGDEARRLADRMNRLRDRLDALVFGYRDYGLLALKPAAGDAARSSSPSGSPNPG